MRRPVAYPGSAFLIPFKRKLLITSLIRVDLPPFGSYIRSRKSSRAVVRKLLIINDAWPNNATAGSFIKSKNGDHSHIRTIQDLLGHTSVNTTMIYTHLRVDSKVETRMPNAPRT
jgi:hypothetical protein